MSVVWNLFGRKKETPQEKEQPNQEKDDKKAKSSSSTSNLTKVEYEKMIKQQKSAYQHEAVSQKGAAALSKDAYAKMIQQQKEMYLIEVEEIHVEQEAREGSMKIVSWASFTNEGTIQIVYTVAVLRIHSDPETIERSYSEFLELHQNLVASQLPNIPTFPPKKRIGNTRPEFVEKRMKDLNDWLAVVLQPPEMFGSTLIQSFISKAWETKRGTRRKSVLERSESGDRRRGSNSVFENQKRAGEKNEAMMLSSGDTDMSPYSPEFTQQLVKLRELDELLKLKEESLKDAEAQTQADELKLQQDEQKLQEREEEDEDSLKRRQDLQEQLELELERQMQLEDQFEQERQEQERQECERQEYERQEQERQEQEELEKKQDEIRRIQLEEQEREKQRQLEKEREETLRKGAVRGRSAVVSNSGIPKPAPQSKSAILEQKSGYGIRPGEKPHKLTAIPEPKPTPPPASPSRNVGHVQIPTAFKPSTPTSTSTSTSNPTSPTLARGLGTKGRVANVINQGVYNNPNQLSQAPSHTTPHVAPVSQGSQVGPRVGNPPKIQSVGTAGIAFKGVPLASSPTKSSTSPSTSTVRSVKSVSSHRAPAKNSGIPDRPPNKPPPATPPISPRKEEERRALEVEKKRLEEERKKAEAEKRAIEEEKKKIEEQRELLRKQMEAQKNAESIIEDQEIAREVIVSVTKARQEAQDRRNRDLLEEDILEEKEKAWKQSKRDLGKMIRSISWKMPDGKVEFKLKST
eukprot:TRINITY_DN5602_c0_g1_i2.p1 TRINITY_DN5602_c0_g1~~TRINITY_DN5602_c0_g1_i2.p1  ORF type:complete len:747 (-),score=328.24 TRINITY_DN5602_c0_g1_i2:164-2404(-)